MAVEEEKTPVCLAMAGRHCSSSIFGSQTRIKKHVKVCNNISMLGKTNINSDMSSVFQEQPRRTRVRASSAELKKRLYFKTLFPDIILEVAEQGLSGYF